MILRLAAYLLDMAMIMDNYAKYDVLTCLQVPQIFITAHLFLVDFAEQYRQKRPQTYTNQWAFCADNFLRSIWGSGRSYVFLVRNIWVVSEMLVQKLMQRLLVLGCLPMRWVLRYISRIMLLDGLSDFVLEVKLIRIPGILMHDYRRRYGIKESILNEFMNPCTKS
jgi:hypothetical protein